MPTPILFATKDNAEGQLSAGINASVLSIPLKAGEGTEFPQPYHGTASSLGSGTVLNDTGDLGSVAQYKVIRNVTDGSWAIVLVTGASSITTTQLRGGSDNTWQASDEWRVDEFIVFLEHVVATVVTKREKCLVIDRVTDTLTVATGGRGYDGSTAQTFSTDDYVRLHVASKSIEEMIKGIADAMVMGNTLTASIATVVSNLASTANALGASLIGIEDAAAGFTATNVESALAELRALIPAGINSIFGDGTDGALTVSIDTNLVPTTVYDYTTLTVNSTRTLSVSSVNEPLIIRTNSNVVINGAINLNGKGGAGGAAGGSTGTAGKCHKSAIFTTLTNGPGIGDVDGGGGGASSLNSGQTKGGGFGAAGTKVTPDLYYYWLVNQGLHAICGGGGGGGAGGRTAGGRTAGGAGGGALMMFIGGNLTLGASSSITANGADGDISNGDGGGGGGGGEIFIIVAGSITNNGVTVSATGGVAQGNADGGAGRIHIYSLADGTLISA